jgi:hypothetical protein
MSLGRTNQLVKSKLLLCEGVDDERFLEALVDFLGLLDIQVISYDGKGNLRSFLKTLAVVPGFDRLLSIGVTRDADNSFGSAFQSVENAVNAQGFKIKTSIFILPDCSSPGMLEDLCINALAPEQIQCINQYLECVQSVAGQLPSNLAKARLYTWLAVQPKPEIRLGEAALKSYLDFDHPAFEPLKRFISDL